MKFFKPLGVRGRLAGAVVAACMGLMGLTSVAAAAPHNPTGEFAPFADCPLNNMEIFDCFIANTTSGSITIGSKVVPVKNPVTLQGGLIQIPNAPAGDEFQFVGAEDGNTLSKAAQPVPGGLLGITAPAWWPQILRDLFNEVVINQGATGVTATMELAKPASSVKVSLLRYIERKGTAVSLPVKIKLSNAFLGGNCYVGSNSNPVTLNLTTGTTAPPLPNTPITGSPGLPVFNEAFNLVTFKGNKLVDNAFAASGANGCGGILFSWAVDPLVNSILGTPSPAGKNAAILEGQSQVAEAPAVRASE
ncbi:MAG: hypothetical protein ACJ76D_00110 [Solirubrobacterales bacterium]